MAWTPISGPGGPLSGPVLGSCRAQQSWPAPWRQMAVALLPIFHWGCGFETSIDLDGPDRDPAGPIWGAGWQTLARPVTSASQCLGSS
jgi:hypothetical protein